MKDISSLMGYRQEIRVVDATMRDGGLVNSFRFSDDFVKELYQSNCEAGVDYMELGYKASTKLFDVNKFGKWKFCNDEDILAVIGENAEKKIKLAAMADVGRCNYREDIHERGSSPLDLIRVACYVNQMPAAIDMVEDAKKKGYEVSCNIMAVSTAQEGDVRVALEMLGHSPVDTIYIVDSFGALYPEQIARIALLYKEYADKYGKKLGIHAHNNQQLAFANTIDAMAYGASYLDATVDGMGRGAGNCALELLLGFLKNPKYKVNPIIKFVQQNMNKLREEGVKWGYDIPYMLTGQYNTHPRPAIQFVSDNREDYYKFANDLYDIINS